MPDRQLCVHFRKSQKVANISILMHVLTLVAIFLGRFDSDLHYKTGLITASVHMIRIKTEENAKVVDSVFGGGGGGG